MKRIATFATLALTGLAALAAPSSADTPGCVSQGEFNNMDRYLSVGQVAGRFDTNGNYRGSDADEFSRGYDACWTSDRVVVWYSLASGLSTRWGLR